MGLFNKLKNLFKGSFYVVDVEVFREFMKRDLQFSIDENLQAASEINVYTGGEKHRVYAWNFSASEDEEEQKKGVKVYYDDEEFDSIDEMIDRKFNFQQGYFKIELTLSDDVWLNEYKANHPELNVEDY